VLDDGFCSAHAWLLAERVVEQDLRDFDLDHDAERVCVSVFLHQETRLDTRLCNLRSKAGQQLGGYFVRVFARAGANDFHRLEPGEAACGKVCHHLVAQSPDHRIQQPSRSSLHYCKVIVINRVEVIHMLVRVRHLNTLRNLNSHGDSRRSNSVMRCLAN